MSETEKLRKELDEQIVIVAAELGQDVLSRALREGNRCQVCFAVRPAEPAQSAELDCGFPNAPESLQDLPAVKILNEIEDLIDATEQLQHRTEKLRDSLRTFE